MHCGTAVDLCNQVIYPKFSREIVITLKHVYKLLKYRNRRRRRRRRRISLTEVHNIHPILANINFGVVKS